jgi:hypothetical protein
LTEVRQIQIDILGLIIYKERLLSMSKEPESKYRNHYRCEICGQEWEEVWDSKCDGECPQCGRSYTPYKSDDITPNPMSKEIEEAVQTIFNHLNSCGSRNEVTEAFLISVSQQHRTLKQSFMRSIVVPLIKQWAEAYRTKAYDLRNEATCKTCVELENVLKDKGFPFI